MGGESFTSAEPAIGAPGRLPARRIDAQGRARVDGRAIVALALPLFVNSSLQAVLNLTDTWFIGRISSQAVAAVGGVYWIVLGSLLLLGGVGMVVQAFAAQAYGGGRRRRAALAAWSGLWASLALAPVFAAIAWAGPWVVPWLGLPPELRAMSVEYWGPRMLGGGAAIALWSVLSFFNGVGHVRRALAINAVVAVLNAGLNEWLMFGLGLGVAGSAWATTLSICAGLGIAMAVFLGETYRRRYASSRMWRPRLRSIVATVSVGLPVGLSIAFDILGLAAFQAMVTRLGAVPGAASQIVMMLTSIAYMPAVGLGMAGTTLVGQSIGAGDRDWARRVGDRTIVLSVGYMFVTGFVLAIAGPWLLPQFVSAADPQAGAVIALGTTLIWIGAAYQFFDGLNIGCGFCLRGAGDTRFPALALLVLAWGLFVPLVHLLAFAPGEGWVAWAPGAGWGAVGGWIAAVVYIGLLGTTLAWRWRSGRWRQFSLG
ncbi:MAG: MATE family efflux transporter [Burkholderiales bacterium]